MASNDELYIPNLSKFFSLEQGIISWQSIHDDLRDTPINQKTEQAIQFLRNVTPQKLLKSHQHTLGRPDPTSKSQFEAKTAAINIPLGGSLHYDIEQIKADTQWLSECVKISETAAFRTILLEWQYRPQYELKSGYSEAEIASLHGVAANTVSGSNRAVRALPEYSDLDFHTESARRRRQILIHFQETLSLTKVWLVLLEAQTRQGHDTLTSFARSLLEPSAGCQHYVNTITEITNEMLEGPVQSVVHKEIEEAWYAGQIHRIQALMDVIATCASTKDAFHADVVSDWFQLLEKTNFFSDVGPTPYMTMYQTQAFQTSVTLTTVALLGPLSVMSSPSPPTDHTWAHELEVLTAVCRITARGMDDGIPYILPLSWMLSLMLKDVQNRATEAKNRREDPHVQKAIDQTATLDTASGRRGSMASSLQQSVWEEMMDVISSVMPDDADPVQALYFISLDRGAINVLVQIINTIKNHNQKYVRHVYQRIIQETLILAGEVLGYCAEVLEPQLSLLDTTATSSITDQSVVDEPSTIFAHSEHLMGHIFATAAGRFPHDTLPFLQLCRCLATSNHFNEKGTHQITFLLQSLDSFTHSAVKQFAQYRTIREDENLNLVALNQTVQALTPAHGNSITYGHSAQASLVVPADTQGTVISEGEPPIIKWDLTYSGLALIGKWLDLYYRHQLQTLLCEEESASQVAAEVILLLANLLMNTDSMNNQVGDEQRRAAITAILDDANTFYSKGSDVVNCVFDILQQELQTFRQNPRNTFDTSLTNACVCFSQAVLHTRPVVFWTAIGRTGMIGLHGDSGLLYALISGTEIFSGDFKLTRSAAALFTDMIEAALLRPLSLARPGSAASSANLLNSASKQYEAVLYGMTVNMLETFDTLIGSNASESTQTNAIVATLSAALARVLNLRYGFGSTDAPTELNACHDPAAALILDRMRPLSGADAKSGSITQHLLSSVPKSIEQISHFNHEDTHSILDLATNILRCAQTLNLPVAGLELTLLDLTPIIIRRISLSRSSESATRLLVALLDVLRDVGESSLLGFLGSRSSLLLVNVLSSQQALAERAVQVATWSLLRLLISQHQQWLAIVLLTGKVPEKGGKAQDEGTTTYRGKLLFEIALEKLNGIDRLDSTVALAVLRFVAQAQQSWSWTLQSTAREDAFAALVSWVLSLPGKPVSGLTLQVLSRVVDVWSTRLHYAKATRDAILLKQFQPLLEWLTNKAIKTTSYNASLHSNLQRNFFAKFGLDLNSFKSRHLDSTSDHYDLELANVVLGKRPHWTITGRGAEQSYSVEVERANANLGTGDGEMALLSSFHNICIEHAAYIAEHEQMRLVMAHIVQNCLTANKEMFWPGTPSGKTLHSRAEMSLALMRHLAQKQQKSGVDFRNLLMSAWSCTISTYSSYEAAIAADGLAYWRILLSIVMLSLVFHRRKGVAVSSSKTVPHSNPKAGSASELIRKSESPNAVMLEIISVVVGDGLGTVVQLLQAAKQVEMQRQQTEALGEVNEVDVLLIVRMYETILGLGHTSEISAQVSERLLASGAIRSAIQLYACSHLLTSEETDNEPIYAEPSMKLIASMSALPMVAEEMAIEGVLSRILTARVTQVMQRISGGISHVDKRPHCQLLYLIWSGGMLPLTLNLLHGVRGQIAAEVSAFLTRFPSQLGRASTAFSTKASEGITLDLARETATLALVSYILDTYRSAGPSAAVDPRAVLPLVGYDEHRKALSDDISGLMAMTIQALKEKVVPTNERELAWYKDDTLTTKIMDELQSASLCMKKDEGQP